MNIILVELASSCNTIFCLGQYSSVFLQLPYNILPIGKTISHFTKIQNSIVRHSQGTELINSLPPPIKKIKCEQEVQISSHVVFLHKRIYK